MLPSSSIKQFNFEVSAAISPVSAADYTKRVNFDIWPDLEYPVTFNDFFRNFLKKGIR